MLSERRGSFRPQPKQTVAYQVQPSDTLEGIAIRYNITTSELTVLNRLTSRVVFPGQTIYIPEKNSLQVLEEILKQSAAKLAASSEQESPKPGHVERVAEEGKVSCHADTAAGDVPKESLLEDGIKVAKESLRLNSKYVTDGEGVVNGILIVTTNHIMFDPNVSDPLVIEYGMDKYGVEAPMGCIARAALYSDIFRMRTRDATYSGVSDSKANVYHSKNLSMKKSKSHNEKLSKSDRSKFPRRFSAAEVGSKRFEFGIPTSNSFQENLARICEAADPNEEEEDNDCDSGNISDVAKPPIKTPLSATSSIDSEDGFPARKTSLTDDDVILSPESGSPRKKSHFEKTKSKLHKGLKKFSLTDGLFSNQSGGRRMSLPAFASLPDLKKSATGKSEKVKSPADIEKAVYVNMVDDKPELFAPLDKLIPRPAKSFCDTPLYLCLRMGEPMDPKPSLHSTLIHFKHKMKPEYWFSIPKDSVDSLYFFFLRWCPEKYGDIDKMDLESLGFNAPPSEEEDEGGDEPRGDELGGGGHRRASWAFPWRRKSKDVSEMTHVTSPEGWEFLDYMGVRSEVHPPELLTPSKILNEEQLLELNRHLPARAMNPWELAYGSEEHGFSLKTMYRAMVRYDSPVLIVIANSAHEVFGALLSSPLRMSDHFYGTGESFLYTFTPEFKIYHWSGENDYFIKGNTDSFFVGSSEGHFGLWLDDDLFRGRTNSCQTFANEPLCVAEDFVVKALEAWAFV